jgi:Ser/Thr protein kinase RdoA (MazF antagonist)
MPPFVSPGRRRALIEPTKLRGGDVSPVQRVGDTVRRPVGPWSAAVHSLLGHFEAVGFDAAPSFLGIDEGGREILSFVDGEPAVAPVPAGDEAVAALAQLLRRMHDCQAGYTPPENAVWQSMPDARPVGEVVCHNDFFWPNVICRGGLPHGLIDWDLAAPGRRIDDLASAAYFWVPLRPDKGARQWGLPTTSRPQRLRLLCDAYGLTASERGELLDAIVGYCHRAYEAHRIWGALERRPGWYRMWKSGSGKLIRDNLTYIEKHRTALERALE